MKLRWGVIMGTTVAITVLMLLVLLAVIRREDPDPQLYPVGGIDISHHQGEIDWDAVAASGVEFAFMKSTEGRDFSDPRFVENWQKAREAGIARGAYHFFTFCSPGLDQAEHFLTVVPPEEGALRPVADVEFAGNCSSYDDLEQVRKELEIFLLEVERAWGEAPILYLTFRSKLQLADTRFTRYPVWLRNVFWRLPGDAASHWTIWQYADDGEVAGIDGPVDLNVLHPDASVASLRTGR